jgi:hypothetical protein
MARLSLPYRKFSGQSLLLFALASGALFVLPLHAQVLTVESTHVDRQYSQVSPTQVALSSNKMTGKTRQELIRILTAEQGFAMRPLPRGHRGLTLQANGPLEPAGQDYLDLMNSQGMSVKPGDRIILSNVKVENDRIILDLNGGPDHKHRFLRHVSVGANPNYTNPIVPDNDPEPTGSRITLTFKGGIPEVTGQQVKSLLSPLLDFGLKTPVQAYTDTLPQVLKDAILQHRVLVGMNSQMVLAAKGQPDSKTREVEGKTHFEEWIYGQAPKDVEFVRFVGSRVTRVEIAKVGEAPVVRTADETGGAIPPTTRTVNMGDTQTGGSETSASKAPPTLRKPGEKLPNDDKKDTQGTMQPVQFPKDTDEKQKDTDQKQPNEKQPDPSSSSAPQSPSSPQ